MRIAVAVWHNRISPVFDVSREMRILEVRDGKIGREDVETYACDNPVKRVVRLRELRVQTLICGAISQHFREMLTASGMNVIAFTAGNIEDVLRAYLAGALPQPALSMPGCGCPKRRSGHPANQAPMNAGQHKFRSNNASQKGKGTIIMPRGDGTGPDGNGPLGGRGCGGGRGGGRGTRQRVGAGGIPSLKDKPGTESGRNRPPGTDDRKKTNNQTQRSTFNHE